MNPAMKMAMDISVVATGRSMNRRQKFMRPVYPQTAPGSLLIGHKMSVIRRAGSQKSGIPAGWAEGWVI